MVKTIALFEKAEEILVLEVLKIIDSPCPIVVFISLCSKTILKH